MLFIHRVAAIISLLILSVVSADAHEISSRYATIKYDKPELLKKFNSELLLGNLSHLMRYKRTITWEDEVKNKVDIVVERVIAVLNMKPANVKFSIVLLQNESEVQHIYKTLYNLKVDFIAFYSPKDRTVYLSVSDIRIGVFAHELGHLIVDLFYGVATPMKIHELLAQFVEKHLMDD